MTAAPSPYRIVPADRVDWDDVRTVFGSTGTASRCWCQRYRLHRGESFSSFPAQEREHRLREQVEGCPGSAAGLIAYLGDDPVGWCAVGPRPRFEGLLRNNRVPWDGRSEDRADQDVWAVTCLFARAGYRRRGVSRALAVAAVGFARERGARAIEGYPMVTTNAISEELHVGTVPTFAAAGLVEVGRPTQRRAVMRIEF